MSDLELPKSVLGRTGLSVTTLGYGAMEVRGSRIWGGRPIEDAEAEQILNAVVDNGINFIDTANDYGRSEEYIGRFLSRRRDEFVLATSAAAPSCAATRTPMTPLTSGPGRTCSAAYTRVLSGCEPTMSI